MALFKFQNLCVVCGTPCFPCIDLRPAEHPGGPDGEILPERLAEETARFMEDMAEKGQPFFAYLSFYAVHAPIQTTDTKKGTVKTGSDLRAGRK